MGGEVRGSRRLTRVTSEIKERSHVRLLCAGGSLQRVRARAPVRPLAAALLRVPAHPVRRGHGPVHEVRRAEVRSRGRTHPGLRVVQVGRARVPRQRAHARVGPVDARHHALVAQRARGEGARGPLGQVQGAHEGVLGGGGLARAAGVGVEGALRGGGRGARDNTRLRGRSTRERSHEGNGRRAAQESGTGTESSQAFGPVCGGSGREGGERSRREPTCQALPAARNSTSGRQRRREAPARTAHQARRDEVVADDPRCVREARGCAQRARPHGAWGAGGDARGAGFGVQHARGGAERAALRGRRDTGQVGAVAREVLPLGAGVHGGVRCGAPRSGRSRTRAGW